MTILVRGLHAVALAEVFEPHIQLFCGINGDIGKPKEIELDKAHELAQSPLKNSIYVEVSESRLNAIIERLHAYHGAVGSVNEAANELAETVTGERAVFVRETAAKMLASYLLIDKPLPHVDVVSKAVVWAEMLADMIWARIENAVAEEIEKEVESDG